MFRRVLLCSCLLLVPSLSSAAEPATEEAIGLLRSVASGAAELTRSGVTGVVTFFSSGERSGVLVPDPSATAPSARALSFLETYGQAFGLSSAADLQLKSMTSDELQMDHVRFQQLHEGIPVTGGEVIVHLRGNRILAANGKALPDLEEILVTPAVAANDALTSAADILRKHIGVDDAELSAPRLEVFNRGLLEDRAAPTRLAWFIEATRIDLREYLWIDATTGAVLLHFSQLPEAKNRTIYNGNNSSSLPGTLMRTEGGPATGDADADDAYTYSGATYDYFLAQHGRDSFDGLGGELRSTVHNCPSPAECPLPNAFWNGTQMIYGEGYASSDDVVAHELTHAVTNYTADLFYYMQSGALNESFSDILGETVDLSDSLGNDSPGVRWQLGEDLSGGAIRSLMNPPAFGQPGKVSDSNFQCPSGSFFDGDLDRGGVHTNSGVPNHGYALMVDGGTYNGRTVVGIGLTKAAKIQYRALATYLVSASGFADTYSALNRSCTDLVGVAGISAADCIQVRNALDAVELAGTLPCNPAHSVAPPLCPSGYTAADLSLIDFETGIGFPSCPTNGTAPTSWCDYSEGSFGGPYSTSGTHSLWGYNRPEAGDLSSTISWNGVLPANAKLQFHHSHSFESDSDGFYDGGVVEYSTNSGSSWLDAASLFSAGATYRGTLDNSNGNPLAGRSAFVGESWGYTATQLNLASLAGQPFRLRFRLGTDASVNDWGWNIDDVRIYQCVSGGNACVPGPNTACLLSGRFKVEVQWTDFSAVTRNAFVASAGTSDTALFYWTNPNNWELLIKGINACTLNNKFWIYFAAATNVGYRVTVTDTQAGGAPKVYTNAVGNLAQATNDINAFACP